jgi:hypothetical protein
MEGFSTTILYFNLLCTPINGMLLPMFSTSYILSCQAQAVHHCQTACIISLIKCHCSAFLSRLSNVEYMPQDQFLPWGKKFPSFHACSLSSG